MTSLAAKTEVMSVEKDTTEDAPLRKPPLRRPPEFEVSTDPGGGQPRKIDYQNRKFNGTRIWYPSRTFLRSDLAHKNPQQNSDGSSNLHDPPPSKVIITDNSTKADRFAILSNTKRKTVRFNKPNLTTNLAGNDKSMSCLYRQGDTSAQPTFNYRTRQTMHHDVSLSSGNYNTATSYRFQNNPTSSPNQGWFTPNTKTTQPFLPSPVAALPTSNPLLNTLADAFRIPVNTLSRTLMPPQATPDSLPTPIFPPTRFIQTPVYPPVRPITIQQQQDADTPPRFRPKSNAFVTPKHSNNQNHTISNAQPQQLESNVNGSFGGQEQIHWPQQSSTFINTPAKSMSLTEPQRICPNFTISPPSINDFHNNAFDYHRKCKSNDSNDWINSTSKRSPPTIALKKRMCQSTVNLSSGVVNPEETKRNSGASRWMFFKNSIGQGYNSNVVRKPTSRNVHRGSCGLRRNDYRPQTHHHHNLQQQPHQPIPLSAYIAATNQLQKRDSRFAFSSSALALDCCCNQRKAGFCCSSKPPPAADSGDIFSQYRLDEDDISLFGSESPIPGAITADTESLSLSELSIDDEKSMTFCDSSSLDEDALDETLNRLEKDLIDSDAVNLEDILRDAHGNDDPVKVYQTKDFMQWARLYFNSQLKKKIKPEVMDWASNGGVVNHDDFELNAQLENSVSPANCYFYRNSSPDDNGNTSSYAPSSSSSDCTFNSALSEESSPLNNSGIDLLNDQMDRTLHIDTT